MSDNKLSQLLGDYRSDGSESDEADDDAGKSRNDANNENESKIDTNWTQCIDKNTGHPYYWNIVTKEVTWEMPDDYERFLRQNVIDSRRRSVKNTWILCQGDDQTEYYFNEYTRAISWDKPTDYVDPVEYVQPISDEHSNVQQVRGQDNASKQTTQSQRKPKEISGKTQSTQNNNNLAIPASSSSAEPESRHNAERNNFQSEKGASINLVPEYNSDEDDTGDDVDTDNNKLTKTTDSSKATSSNDASTIGQSSAEENKSLPFTKTISSFASIIVGGRSPNQETQNSPSPDTETNDGENITADLMAIEKEHLSQKQFKRKRRIEFSIQHKRDTNPSENSGADEATVAEEICENNGTETGASASKLTAGNLYENFQRESSESQTKSDRKSAEPEPVSDIQRTSDEISHIKDVLEAKLQFLGQGQNEIELKPVQVMHIQLQTLVEAHTLNALHPEYLLAWLNNVSSDLIQLEKDAAPAGWKCVWNRDEGKYCYENLESGCVQYEYPEETNPNQMVHDDDEMDICTTPPLSEEPVNVIESRPFVPEPPNWSHAKAACIRKQKVTNEPLPPGIDAPDQNETPLEDELATFYSDIASLDQPGTASTETSTNPPNDSSEKGAEGTIDSCSDATEEKKKRKRKKQKQLEPWRSGNLETWINKWQKAQKELDG